MGNLPKRPYAGNDYGANVDVTPVYPASYNFSNVISVIALNESGLLADYSNFGPASTDIAAPGSDILSTELSGRLICLVARVNGFLNL